MQKQHAFDSLSIARAYVAAGLSLIPIAPGTKQPHASLLPRVWDEDKQEMIPTWRPLQERQPTDRELLHWFSRHDAGIGIVGGAISGGLVVLDCESVAAYEA